MTLVSQLSALETSYLVQLETTYPELAYVFRHVLVRDAVYATLVRRERSFWHQAVGEAIERLHPDPAEAPALAPQLGAHFAEAGDDVRALKYLTLAGDQAAQQYANHEAAQYYGRALEVARGQPRAPVVHLYLARGRTLELCGDYGQALAAYKEMEAQAISRADPSLELEALSSQAHLQNALTPVSDPVQGQALLERALQLARQLGDRVAEVRLLLDQLRSNVWSRNPVRAVVIGEQAVATARLLDLPELLIEGLIQLAAWGYLNTARLRLAGQQLVEAEALLRVHVDPRQRLDCLIELDQVAFLNGDFNAMRDYLAEMWQISQTMSYGWGLANYHSFSGGVALEEGNLAEAISELEEGIRLGRQFSAGQAELVTCAFLARALAEVGETAAGLAAVRQVRDSMTPAKPNYFWPLLAEVWLLVVDGQVAEAGEVIARVHHLGDAPDFVAYRLMFWAEAELGLAEGRYEQVVGQIDKVIADMRAEGARLLVCEALVFGGRALAGAGDLENAKNALMEAVALAETMGLRLSLWPALAALADVETRRGHLDEAQSLRRDLRSVIEYLADRTGSPERRAGLLARPAVRAALLT